MKVSYLRYSLNNLYMTITKQQQDPRPHIIDTFSVVVDLKEDDQQHIDTDYIKFYFEGDYPNKEVCVMYLSNSPSLFQEDKENPNEDWYEVSIMEPDEKLNSFIETI